MACPCCRRCTTLLHPLCRNLLVISIASSWGLARCCKKEPKENPKGGAGKAPRLPASSTPPRSTPKPYWHQIPFPHRHQSWCCSFVKLEAEKQDPFLDPCGQSQAERHQGSDRGPPPPASIAPKGMGRAGRSQPRTSLLHTSGTIPRPAGSGAVTKPQFSQLTQTGDGSKEDLGKPTRRRSARPVRAARASCCVSLQLPYLTRRCQQGITRIEF